MDRQGAVAQLRRAADTFAQTQLADLNTADRWCVGLSGGPDSLALTAVAAQLRPIQVRKLPAAGIIAVASRSHRTPETDAYLARYSIAELVAVGSSLKFCLVAAGEADLYPRLGPTMEWDTAAGHAVLLAAGGRVLGADGQPLGYGKPQFRNPWFVASGAFVPHAFAA